jgi:hypothetical protein
MTESMKDTGVKLAQVDRGELLSDQDLAFLERVFEDAQQVKSLVHQHPEWQPLAAHAGKS